MSQNTFQLNKINIDEKNYRKTHDKFVDFRDKFLGVGPRFFIRKRLIMQLLKDSKGLLIDIGCGEGELLLQLVDAGFYCTGLDMSEEAIERCKMKLKNCSVTLKCIDISCFKPSPKFDIAVCSEVIEHIKDDGLFVREINRIMKIRSILVASVPLDMKLWSRYDEQGHYRRYTKKEFVELLEVSGFKVKKTIIWGYPLMRLMYQWIRAPQYYSSMKKCKFNLKNLLMKIKPVLNIIKYIFLFDNAFNFTERGVGIIIKAQKINEVT